MYPIQILTHRWRLYIYLSSYHPRYHRIAYINFTIPRSPIHGVANSVKPLFETETNFRIHPAYKTHSIICNFEFCLRTTAHHNLNFTPLSFGQCNRLF